MNNPIVAIRQQLNEQANEPANPRPQDNKGFDPNLKALHQGWLEHPVTVERLEALKKELQAAENNLKFYSAQSNIPDSFVRSLVIGYFTAKDSVRILTTN